LKVVALGVGTKFMSTLHADSSGSLSRDHFLCVRDCHAEVLARRAFLMYLYEEADAALTGRPSAVLELTVPSRKRSREDLSQSDSACYCPPLRMKDHIRIHFYTSSMPCGNACIKRWAKSSKVVPIEGLTSVEYPHPPSHPHLHITARDQGQVSVLVKRGSCCTFPLLRPPSWCPPGTAPPNGGANGRVMSCSDKMAMWNAVGLQGALLARLVLAPLRLTTVTVGRKFSEPHAARALCCRLQSFRSPAPQFSFPRAAHPTLLCTAIKLDSGAIRTGPEVETAGNEVIGASFSEKRCLYWYSCGDECEESYERSVVVLDGDTGKLWEEGLPADICSASLYAKYMMCQSKVKGDIDSYSPGYTSFDVEEYLRAKRSPNAADDGGYTVTKDALLSDPQYFGEWVRTSANPIVIAEYQQVQTTPNTEI